MPLIVSQIATDASCILFNPKNRHIITVPQFVIIVVCEFFFFFLMPRSLQIYSTVADPFLDMRTKTTTPIKIPIPRKSANGRHFFSFGGPTAEVVIFKNDKGCSKWMTS
uniref:Uncharacterized protein n=1 Tax=Asterionellopsis glacialis TaxID=33640 RepID=A0A6T9YKG4_9STRA